MEARDVGARMTTFMVLLYSVYMGALLFGGIGLYTGHHPRRRLVRHDDRPRDLRRRRSSPSSPSAQLVKPGEGRVRRVLAPVGDGVRDARRLVRMGNPGLARRR